MNSALQNLLNHLHGGASHFPIALLALGVVLDLLARRRAQLAASAWLLLVLGTLAAVVSTVTGLAAHIAYEDTPLAAPIEIHQYFAFATTAIFVGLIFWRWRLRRGSAAPPALWLIGSLVGLIVLLITGYLGGNLLLQYGVGVQGITR